MKKLKLTVHFNTFSQQLPGSRQSEVSYFDVPVFVEVVYSCDASAVLVRIVHMSDVARPVARVVGHHRLWQTNKQL